MEGEVPVGTGVTSVTVGFVTPVGNGTGQYAGLWVMEQVSLWSGQSL